MQTASSKLSTTVLAPLATGKPLLVVAPSLGTSAAALWSGVAARLAGEFGIIGVDLPGHGASALNGAPLGTITDLAKALLAAVEAESGGKPFCYAGVSVSGCIGLQLLLSAPDRIAKAAIINSAAKIGEHAGWMERAAYVRGAGTGSMRESSPARWFAPGFADANPAVAGALLDALAAANAEGYARTCEALADFDVRRDIHSITRPVLVIGGENDVATPPEQQKFLAKEIPGARVEILANAGHLSPAEKPEMVARLLSDFFR